ncbi:MAG TPA: DUF2779 domain-containing protein [Gammaproteobacteria bacterium]|nr:DUF2779 domain-containing protein [Gammaproteobacteria bacterium]
MNPPQQKYLSKSSFMAGLDCPRKLWQLLWDRSSAAPFGGMSQLIMEMGTRFGTLAHQLYPGATLIDVDFRNLDQALLDTEAAIASGASTILEACFVYDHFRVVSDVVERQADGSWHLVEVKSSTSVKARHIPDLAYQKWVMQQAGFRVSRCSVLHANRSGSWPDVASIFKLVDVTEEVNDWTPNVEPALEIMRPLMVKGSAAPEARPLFSRKCHDCPFKETVCWKDIDGFTIYDVINASCLPALEAEGILYINDISEEQKEQTLNKKDRANVDRIQQQRIDINQDVIKDRLNELVTPIYFLDFESIATAVPLFDSIAPWKQLAFQYSLHVLHEDGRLEHCEYLHRDASDPSEAVAKRLCEDIGDVGSIVVYFANMERGVLNSLRNQFPEYAPALKSMTERLWDLHPVFEKHYRHWKFGSKSSIKVVLPTLVPELSYKDLEIQEGGSASLGWLQMIESDDETSRELLARDLLAYCGLDTLAMVQLLGVLKS